MSFSHGVHEGRKFCFLLDRSGHLALLGRTLLDRNLHFPIPDAHRFPGETRKSDMCHPCTCVSCFSFCLLLSWVGACEDDLWYGDQLREIDDAARRARHCRGPGDPVVSRQPLCLDSDPVQNQQVAIRIEREIGSRTSIKDTLVCGKASV